MGEIEPEPQSVDPQSQQPELQDPRSKYSKLYDLAPIGYLTLNKAGKILDANLATAKQLGIERRRLLNSFLGSYANREGRDRILLHLQQVSKSRRQGSVEVMLQAKTGDDFCAWLESVPWRSDDGREVYFTSLIDISQCKRTERRLMKTNAALRRQVEEDTLLDTNFSPSEKSLGKDFENLPFGPEAAG